MKPMQKLISAVFAALLTTAPVVAADRAIIILDASGSMWAQIDGKAKITVARETLAQVLKGVPADLELGFMAYGHRQKAACDDIELLVPPATGTAAAISAAADGITPKGKTPLSAAVRQAAELLKYTEDKATVILITDGLETCNADPCALASELEKSGVDFTVNVVGFGLSANEGKQVACLATNTGGQYFDARDARGLTDALTKTVAAIAAPAPAPKPVPAAPPAAAPEFNLVPELVMAEGGPPVKTNANGWEIYAVNADGSKGDSLDTEYGAPQSFKLAPGKYIVKAFWDVAAVEQPVTIEAGQVAKPVFDLNAGTLIVHPRPAKDADVMGSAAVDTEFPGDHTTTYGNTKIVVPAGDLTVTVTIDAGKAVEKFALAAGQTVEKDIVVGVGHVTANALYSEGGDQVSDGGLTFHFQKAKKKIDGSREDVGTNYGADTQRDLPPGDYVVTVTMDQASLDVPFTVKIGEPIALNPTLNAGVAAISAPGAEKIEVFGTKKDIEGKLKAFSYGYGEKLQTTLPAGDYTVTATMPDGGAAKESPLHVDAGQRSEITVP